MNPINNNILKKSRFLFRLFNLPSDVNKDEIYKFINKISPVSNIFPSLDTTGNTCGWMWVEFNNKADMLNAYDKLHSDKWNTNMIYILLS